MSDGWIKLHRAIRKHWVWEDPLLLKIWLDVLLSANHKDRKILINGSLINIGTGQFWTSKRKMANALGISKDTVKRKLDLLQSDGMIFMDSQKGVGTLITVLNYKEYQGFYADGCDTNEDTDKDTYEDTDKDKYEISISHKQELTRINKNEQEYIGSAGGYDV